MGVHVELHEEFQQKELEKNDFKTLTKNQAHRKLFNPVKRNIQISLDMKGIIDACVEIVTVNGRPFSALNDSGFCKILHPLLTGINNKVAINSESIRLKI